MIEFFFLLTYNDRIFFPAIYGTTVCFQTETLGSLFKYINNIFFTLLFLLLHRLVVRISLSFHIFLREREPRNEFAIVFTEYVWTEAVSGKKKLRIQNYRVTSGRGLIIFIALEKCKKKTAILFKLFRDRVFVH